MGGFAPKSSDSNYGNPKNNFAYVEVMGRLPNQESKGAKLFNKHLRRKHFKF